jgi:hypothetical protein
LIAKRKLVNGRGGGKVEIVVAPADLIWDPSTRLFLADNPKDPRFEGDGESGRGNEDCFENPDVPKLSMSPEVGFPGFGGVCSLVVTCLEFPLPGGKNESDCFGCLRISVNLAIDAFSPISAFEGSCESV